MWAQLLLNAFERYNAASLIIFLTFHESGYWSNMTHPPRMVLWDKSDNHPQMWGASGLQAWGVLSLLSSWQRPEDWSIIQPLHLQTRTGSHLRRLWQRLSWKWNDQEVSAQPQSQLLQLRLEDSDFYTLKAFCLLVQLIFYPFCKNWSGVWNLQKSILIICGLQINETNCSF